MFMIPLLFSALASGAAIWNQIDQNSQLQAAASDSLKKTEADNVASKLEQDIKYVAAVDAANAEAEQLRLNAEQTARVTRTAITITFILLAVVSLALTIRMLNTRQ